MYCAKCLKIYLIIIVALIISGCSISDPQQGGLIGGLIGLGSGQYKRDTEELKPELTKAQAEARKANDEVNLSVVKVEHKHRELIEVRNAIEHTAEEIHSFTAYANANDIPDAQQTKSDLFERLNILNTRNTKLQQQAQSTLADPTATRDWEKIELLKEEVQQINKELEALWQTLKEPY